MKSKSWIRWVIFLDDNTPFQIFKTLKQARMQKLLVYEKEDFIIHKVKITEIKPKRMRK